MPNFEYQIVDNHLRINVSGQSYWVSLQGMKSLPYARCFDPNKVNGMPVGPAGVQAVILDITFPERTLNLSINYNDIHEGAQLLNKIEQLIKDLIAYSKKDVSNSSCVGVH